MSARSRKPRDRRQPSLFGEPPVPPPADRVVVGPAEVLPEHAEIADRMPPEVLLGTSSWSFPGWRGIVYDRAASAAKLARHGLAAYARHPLLRAVGIDRTYYAPLAAEDLAAYAAVVPEEFRFLVKAPSLCTSPFLRDARGRPTETNATFLDAVWTVDAVVGPFVEGLGERGAALVFQFTPLGRAWTAEPSRFVERLGRFLSGLPRGPRYVVEIRDRAVFGSGYLDCLRSAGAGHCLNVHPRMPGIAVQWRRAAPCHEGPIVVRWMLHAGLDYEGARERYEPFSRIVDEDPETRTFLAGLCSDPDALRRPIVVVANNKAEGSAPLTLFRLAGEIVRRLSCAGQ